MAGSTTDAVWYFAYGSNMQRATFAGRRGIEPRTSQWARLDGYRLVFDLPIGPGERGVANIVRDDATSTYGVAHRITPEELDFLDRTEGVPRGVYERLHVEITIEDRHSAPAVAYISSHGVAGRKPSPRYMGLLLEGAREHGVPAGYIACLESFDLAVDERKAP